MKLWLQVQAFAAKCWRKCKRAFKRPSIETIAGMSTGAALGRAIMWYWMAGVFFFAHFYLVAVIAALLASWDLWMNFHVFRFLSEYYALRYGERPAGVATVTNLSDFHPANT